MVSLNESKLILGATGSLNFDRRPPSISPVPEGMARPLWSVMIPTFNCAIYLRQTLESVLAQAPGPERMQIEVIDDCSMKDDPEVVVREVGKGRVAFYRQPKNGGAIANFNTCIARSRGHLVHILHGDDYVLPGFYARIEGAAESRPELAFFATRAFYVDEESIITGVTPRIPELETGSRSARCFYYATPIHTPSVVIRRGFYEAHGGFLPPLIHTADCEMWARAIGEGGGLHTSEVLACYRVFAANDTGKLMRTAENLRDLDRVFSLFAGRYEGYDRKRARDTVCRRAWLQISKFEALGDEEAAKANRTYFREHAPLLLQLRAFVWWIVNGSRRLMGRSPSQSGAA